MTNSKHTKRSLLASVLSVVLCVAMLVGTTFAWFTDSVTSGNNKIQAGNLNIDLLVKDENGTYQSVKENNAPIFNYDKWEPGYTVVKNVKVSTKGNLALKYTMNIVAEGEVSALADVIDVYYAASEVNVTDRELAGLTKLGTLRDVLEGKENTVVNDTLIPDENNTEDFATIALKMREEAGNEYQGMSIGEFDLQIVATQYTYEEDSFGNDYDANANAEAVFGKDIVEKLNDPSVSEVVAGGNIDMNSKDFQESNGNCTVVIPDGKTLDLNQNTVIRPEGGSGNGLSFKAGTTGTVKNGTVFAQGDMCAVDIGEGATVHFEDINFEGHGNEILKVRAAASEKTTVIFRNCTFNNAPVTLSGRNGATEIDIQFVNCAFTGTYKMYDEQGNALTDPHGNVHYTQYLINATSYYLYGNVKIENCTFDFDASEAKYAEEAIELYGCYQSNYPGKMLNILLKDVTITGKNITPIEIDSRYDDGLVLTEEGTNRYIVDGVEVNYDGIKK